MEKYIPKDAVLAEIDKKLSYYKDLESRGLLSKEGEAAFRAVRILKSDIDSLEVKEVDLEKEYDDFIETIDELHKGTLLMLAKHFFELGLKAQKGE